MNSIFSHNSIVQNATGGITEFYGCTLKRDIGEYKKGDYFSCIELHVGQLELMFYDETDKVLMVKRFILE